jgi:serine O-acetyltransferase
MGVVVGETAIIGDDCVIYQGVTLGAGAAARMGHLTRGTKRHPTLGTGVIVGSNAEIQGDITLGDNVRVASGSIVLKDVPANSIVVGVPGRVIYRDGQRVKDDVPDIEAEAIKSLKEHISRLEHEVKRLGALMATQTQPESAVKTDKVTADETSEDDVDPVDVFLHGAGI